MRLIKLFLLSIFLYSCKTGSLIGKYESCFDNCFSLILNEDSTFQKSSLTSMSSSSSKGKWWVEKKLLIIKPDLDSGIFYDSIEKRYFRYWQLKLKDSLIFDSIKWDVHSEYSMDKFKIKGKKLYWQYTDRNNKIKFSYCPYFKLPNDSNKIEIARWKNSVDCELGPNALFNRIFYKYFKRPNKK